jgi:hypothetical protein
MGAFEVDAAPKLLPALVEGGQLREPHHRGGARVNWQFLFAAAADNPARERRNRRSARVAW